MSCVDRPMVKTTKLTVGCIWPQQSWSLSQFSARLAALTAHLDLKNAIHVGHSTGGGEVAHYLGQHGESRVTKAALISAVPPLMVKTAANPNGLPKEVFDGLQAQLAANRSNFYRALPEGPFYGYNRPGVKASEAIIANWWRQGMMGGAKAHYDGIVAFSQTDFTKDLKKITVPVLVMHGEDDQIVPYVASGPMSAKLLKNGTLKTYTPALRIGQDVCRTAGRAHKSGSRFDGCELRWQVQIIRRRRATMPTLIAGGD